MVGGGGDPYGAVWEGKTLDPRGDKVNFGILAWAYIDLS